jgi:cysteine-rich repeat protein
MDAGPDCGNGVVEGTEQCDDSNPITGDGCESDCTFSCETADDCSNGNDCDGDEVCNTALHRCQGGTPLPDGNDCTRYVTMNVIPDGGVPDGGIPDGGIPVLVP